MKKVLVIVGPTASGKSSFGIDCALSFKGEIISGDSIQIYKGLDIGSAKVSLKEQSIVPHHLIDLLDPKKAYSVSDFQKYARKLIDEISERGGLPIIVGGTGLYIKACLYDYVFYEEQQQDDPFDDLSNEEIYQILKEKDPKCLEKIHVNNRKRLVRALNVYYKHDIGISEISLKQEHKPIYDVEMIGLTCEREILYQRISERVDRMIDDGLISEISSLLEKGVSFDDRCMQGIGYKEFCPYFENEKTLAECIEDVKRNTRKFAKRQYTWFNNQMDVKWYEDPVQAKKDIELWLNTSED